MLEEYYYSVLLVLVKLSLPGTFCFLSVISGELMLKLYVILKNIGGKFSCGALRPFCVIQSQLT